MNSDTPSAAAPLTTEELTRARERVAAMKQRRPDALGVSIDFDEIDRLLATIDFLQRERDAQAERLRQLSDNVEKAIQERYDYSERIGTWEARHGGMWVPWLSLARLIFPELADVPPQEYVPIEDELANLRERVRELESLATRVAEALALLSNPMALNTVELRNEMAPFFNEWAVKVGQHPEWRYDSSDRQLLDYVLVALLAKVRIALEPESAALKAKGEGE